MMIVIGVLAVFIAVGSERAGVAVGLSMVVGPAVGYLLVRARRVNRGEERPSAIERALGEVAVTTFLLSAAASALAAVTIIGLMLVDVVSGWF